MRTDLGGRSLRLARRRDLARTTAPTATSTTSAAFVDVNRVLLQGCDVADNPNHAIAADNRARLEAAGVDVVMIDDLPYATVGGETVPVPYGNFYVCNGAVIVPTVDGGRGPMARHDRRCFADRDVVPVPGEVLAYGGGGVHCITQQVLA